MAVRRRGLEVAVSRMLLLNRNTRPEKRAKLEVLTTYCLSLILIACAAAARAAYPQNAKIVAPLVARGAKAAKDEADSGARNGRKTLKVFNEAINQHPYSDDWRLSLCTDVIGACICTILDSGGSRSARVLRRLR